MFHSLLIILSQPLNNPSSFFTIGLDQLLLSGLLLVIFTVFTLHIQLMFYQNSLSPSAEMTLVILFPISWVALLRMMFVMQ